MWYLFVCLFNYLEGLTQVIVEADTSPVCCQEAGDPGRLAVWVQSKSGGLGTRGEMPAVVRAAWGGDSKGELIHVDWAELLNK